MYLITFQWGKLNDIEWPSFQSDAFTRPLGEYDSPVVQLDTTSLSSTSDLSSDYTSPTGSTTGAGGASSSYGGQNLTVNVEINAEAIVGEPGLREFALMIQNEIERAQGMGLV